jgi:anti-anti-sigma factor
VHDRRGLARYLLLITAITVAYTVSGKLGLRLAFATRSVTAIWPPTGIALAALVVGGYRLWPAIALGALLTNIDTGVPAVTVLGIVCGNTLEALTGAFLLRRVGDFRMSLERLSDVFSLVVYGAVISTVVSASIGVVSLLLGDVIATAHAASVWRTWWLGDMGGDLIVAPVLLIAASRPSFARLPGGPLEAAVLTLVLSGVSVLVFSQPTNLVYVIFPLLIWAALRFWQPGAAAGSFLVAIVAVAFTANGKGPFAMNGPDTRLLLAQTFVSVAGVSALLLAAVTRSRWQAEHAEREIAETLQHSLMPDAPPPIPGWEIATLYRPAGAAEVQVGGDFYDFFVTDAGWTVIVGDVAGKGVEAAAMAALVRYGARFVNENEQGPAAILARLNNALRQQSRLSLCSALCVRLQQDHLLVSSAGHPGPLIVRRDGRLRKIGGAGPLLGIFPDAAWPERMVALGPEETVLLYTDGVTDTRGEDDRFGQRRLEELLIARAHLSPADLLTELEQTLSNFQRGSQIDDTAALALRLAGSRLIGQTVGRARPSRGTRGASINPPTLRVESVANDNKRTINATGEICHTTTRELMEAFERGTHTAGSELVLDLAEVTFVDSAGLRALLEIEREASERALRLSIVAPPEHVRAVFRLSGMDERTLFASHAGEDSTEQQYIERLELELAVSDSAPGQARAEIREAIAEEFPDTETETAVLLTSELVTNALLHPTHRNGDSIGLRLELGVGRLRVEVADSGSGFDHDALRRDEGTPGGWGLVLVDRGALRWGTSRGDRFRVWFELSSPRSPGAMSIQRRPRMPKRA